MSGPPEDEGEGSWSYERLEAMQEELLGPPEPKTPQQKKRARIVRAATELFIRQGYRKTSVSEIARRASVAKGTVYLYFRSKADLLIHAIATEKRVLNERFRPLFDGSIPDEERLTYVVRMVFTASRDLPLVTRLSRGDRELVAALEEADPAMLAQNYAQGEDLYMQIIEGAAPGRFEEEQKRRRADVLIALGYLGMHLDNPLLLRERSLDEMAAIFADVVVHGVLHPHPKPSFDEQT